MCVGNRDKDKENGDSRCSTLIDRLVDGCRYWFWGGGLIVYRYCKSREKRPWLARYSFIHFVASDGVTRPQEVDNIMDIVRFEAKFQGEEWYLPWWSQCRWPSHGSTVINVSNLQFTSPETLSSTTQGNTNLTANHQTVLADQTSPVRANTAISKKIGVVSESAHFGQPSSITAVFFFILFFQPRFPPKLPPSPHTILSPTLLRDRGGISLPLAASLAELPRPAVPNGVVRHLDWRSSVEFGERKERELLPFCWRWWRRRSRWFCRMIEREVLRQ